MQPLTIDKFDLFLLKQLFPNFKLTLEQLMVKMEKQLLKELADLSKYDVKKFFSLEKVSDVTDDHILTCGFKILFDFEYDELFYEIDTRLNEKLSKLQLEQEDAYQLTKYGLELYSRIGIQSKNRIKEKNILINEITDLSTLKLKTIIANEYESEHKIILTLTQQNIKQAKFNYYEITKNPIHIKGIENEVGIFKTIFHFQFTPAAQVQTRNFTILNFQGKHSNIGTYILKEEHSGELYTIKNNQIEPFIPLHSNYWNYNEGMYESLRGNLKVELYNPVLGSGIILGFDNCEPLNSEEDYLEQTIGNLVDMKLSTKDKDLFQIPIANNKILIIQWTDLENQLDMERREILKKKNTFKRKQEEPMLIRIEGSIRKEEVFIEENHQKIFLFLEEPEIEPENF